MEGKSSIIIILEGKKRVGQMLNSRREFLAADPKQSEAYPSLLELSI